MVEGATHWHDAEQHAPVQGLVGVQVLEEPWYISPPAHPMTPTGLQAQVVMLQQTPRQGVAHVPLQVNVPLQAAPGAVTEQAPVTVLQHLPMQGVGAQEVAPHKKVKPGPVQLACRMPVLHWHDGLQHTPVHGLAVQVLVGPL